MLCLLKTSRGLWILFAAVTQLTEGLSLETILALQLEKPVNSLVGTRRPTLSKTQQK
jgi:hypothetical protein